MAAPSCWYSMLNQSISFYVMFIVAFQHEGRTSTGLCQKLPFCSWLLWYTDSARRFPPVYWYSWSLIHPTPEDAGRKPCLCSSPQYLATYTHWFSTEIFSCIVEAVPNFIFVSRPFSTKNLPFLQEKERTLRKKTSRCDRNFTANIQKKETFFFIFFLVRGLSPTIPWMGNKN